MRLAYADPPYPGCAHFYPEKTEVDHVALVEKLCGYDGWALSTNENALRHVLGLCPPDVRVLAWCKNNAPPFFGHPYPSWEPVICSPARPEPPPVRVAAHIVAPAPSGFVGQQDRPFPGVKPAAFCEWVIRCLGADPADSLDDLFPGTGTMTRAWEAFKQQPSLWSVPVRGSRGHEEKVRRAISDGPELELAS